MDWNRGPIIGRGSTAAVSLAASIPSGKPFAIKSADLVKSAPLQREQTFLSKITSDFIIKYLGHQVTVENNVPTYNLLMEYASGGTLHDEIKRRGGRLDEPEIRSYTRDILMGLEYLHGDDVGLAHCDLKSQNVLLVAQGRARVSDLGCARPVNGDQDTSAFAGTPAFMSPEVARGENQGREADIWSLGCTIIEMATGAHPWVDDRSNVDPVSVLYRIGFSGEVPEFPLWLSWAGRDFLSKCLRREAKERWTAKELLGHPFVGEFGQKDGNVDQELTLSRSPSCVLDQGFWSSTETPREDINWVEIDFNSDANQRIKRLIGLGGDINFSDDFENDGDWITIRGNNFEAGEIDITIDIEEEEDNCIISDGQLVPISSMLLVQNSIAREPEEAHPLLIHDRLFFGDASGSIRNRYASTSGGGLDDFVSEKLEFETDNDYYYSFSSISYSSYFYIFIGFSWQTNFPSQVHRIFNSRSYIVFLYVYIFKLFHI